MSQIFNQTDFKLVTNDNQDDYCKFKEVKTFNSIDFFAV
jgi:hypothetical protein